MLSPGGDVAEVLVEAQHRGVAGLGPGVELLQPLLEAQWRVRRFRWEATPRPRQPRLTAVRAFSARSGRSVCGRPAQPITSPSYSARHIGSPPTRAPPRGADLQGRVQGEVGEHLPPNVSKHAAHSSGRRPGDHLDAVEGPAAGVRRRPRAPARPRGPSPRSRSARRTSATRGRRPPSPHPRALRSVDARGLRGWSRRAGPRPRRAVLG